MNQFGGYDLSPVIDLTWRLQCGEVPGRDFINTMPLALIVLLKILSWTNFTWISFTLLSVFVVILVYLFLASFNEIFFSNSIFYLLTIVIICIPLVFTNHIWHSILSQYLAIIFTYTLYQHYLRTANLNWTSWARLFTASALLVTAKQNIALPVMVLGIGYTIYNRERKAMTINMICLGALTGVFGFTQFLHMPLKDLLYSYSAVTGRAKISKQMIIEILAGESSRFAFILLCILLINLYIYLRNKETMKGTNYLLLTIFISSLPFFTDWDSKLNNISLPLFALALLFCPQSGTKTALNVLEWKPNYSSFHNYTLKIVVAIYVFIFLVALRGGYLRERMKGVGPFYENPSNIQIHGGFFDKLRTGLVFSGILYEIQSIKRDSPNSKLFFGPRLEFGYALTLTHSPYGMPLWWHPGSSYSVNDEGKVVSMFMENNFDILIFSRHDRTRMPSSVLRHIERNFHEINDYQFTDVYQKN